MAKSKIDKRGNRVYSKKRRVISRKHIKELVQKGEFSETEDFERVGFSILHVNKPVYIEYIEIVYNTGEVVKQPIKEAMK